jgi:hypothetical protein
VTVKKTQPVHDISTAQLVCEQAYGKRKAHGYIQNIKARSHRRANPDSRYALDNGLVWTPVVVPRRGTIQVLWDGGRFCYLKGFKWASFSEVRGVNWADPTEMLWNVLAILAHPAPNHIIQGQGCISFFYNYQGHYAGSELVKKTPA